MKDYLGEYFNINYRRNESNLQETLLLLKTKGCTQIETVRILIKELNLSLREADNIVLKSKAWENEKKGTAELRDRFGEALSE